MLKLGLSTNGKRSMSDGQTAYLGMVIAAFSVFAVVLFVTHIRVNLK